MSPSVGARFRGHILQTCEFHAQVTTTLDPDPATASHLIPPESPNFLTWFESNNVTTLVRLNKDKESGKLELQTNRVDFRETCAIMVQV